MARQRSPCAARWSWPTPAVAELRLPTASFSPTDRGAVPFLPLLRAAAGRWERRRSRLARRWRRNRLRRRSERRQRVSGGSVTGPTSFPRCAEEPPRLHGALEGGAGDPSPAA
ncbi:unnamed protein product [Urochloa humidicola]